MRDFATSDSPAVQAQLDRLAQLSLPQGRLSLDPIRALLDRLGNPQRALPPVFHVAGTNGKGSTCAFLRAMLEAQGHRVHVFTSPHLVRYNERIRIAGELVGDAELAALLGDVLDLAGGIAVSFFEVTTAAAFLAFARHPADACVIEVGLGGRLDATNAIEHPAVCGVASLGIDHEAFLLAPEDGTPAEPLVRIAFEKASIAKPGAALVTQAYPAGAAAQIAATAARHGAILVRREYEWDASIGERITYRDAAGTFDLPLPRLAGAHQADNAALAAAMLRHQSAVAVSVETMARGIAAARWPARLQQLGPGPLTALAGSRAVWLDGGHNPDAGAAIAAHFAGLAPLHLIVGMLANKNPTAIAGALGSQIASLTVVPIPGHAAHPAGAFGPGAMYAPDVAAALALLPPGGDVLIAGSLYLAGEVLRLNREVPD